MKYDTNLEDTLTATKNYMENIPYQNRFVTLRDDVENIIGMIDMLMPGLRKSDLTAACMVNIVGELLKTARDKAV